MLGLQAYPGFYTSVWDLNSGFRTCLTSALSPAPQSVDFFSSSPDSGEEPKTRRSLVFISSIYLETTDSRFLVSLTSDVEEFRHFLLMLTE